ncbi:hypothetical protein SOVF_134350 [Spinacia oleracea]|nr:hypothetical protein SOVF_134350 [Spinacia oleracea]
MQFVRQLVAYVEWFCLGAWVSYLRCKHYEKADERLTLLFPYNIDIRPPVDETNLVNWNSQLEEDVKTIQFQDNKNHIDEVLAANDLLVISSGSLSHKLSLFQEGKRMGRKMETNCETGKEMDDSAAVKPDGKNETSGPVLNC